MRTSSALAIPGLAGHVLSAMIASPLQVAEHVHHRLSTPSMQLEAGRGRACEHSQPRSWRIAWMRDSRRVRPQGLMASASASTPTREEERGERVIKLKLSSNLCRSRAATVPRL